MADDIIKEFLVESYENLDRLDQDLLALEKHPDNQETLASIFRTIHTLKGTSGFLALNQLEAVAHVGENLLARLRDGVLRLNPEITTALLAMVDAIRQMLVHIGRAGTEGERNDQELIGKLTYLLDAQPSPGESKQTVQSSLTQEQPQHSAEQATKPPFAPENCDSVHDPGNVQSPTRGQFVGESTIRVDVGQLDRLMNRVGELVLLRNQIVQFTNSSEDAGLLATSQRLNLLTTELQEGVMKTRMQPIGNIWSKFPRSVRDVALSCGKQVRIEMEGKETELDKTIIEAIKDPLTHIVRNSVDHGIEGPDVRAAAGKNPEGLLFLRAFHEGGQVNIEISDDGAGLNYDKIRNKAIQKGMISADQAARMTERETTNLIWSPGFSTAEKVTSVSGRGVGMDVVKTNIEKIGGTVDLQSKPGQGSTVRMKIPLTLAIIPALMVTTAGDRYAIPQVSLLELVRLEGEQARKGIELLNGVPVHRLRGQLLPLVYLNRELSVAADVGEGQVGEVKNANIVVLRADEQQFGLVVDEINDTEEIVVKPLSKQLKSVNTYAGATIMGDGKVALILDVLGLAQRAHVISEVRDRAITEKKKQAAVVAASSRSNAVLLFQYGQSGRMAIDLSLVARLEEFPRETVELAGDQEVVQYRGQIMPLVRVSEALESRRQKRVEGTEESLQVVVYAEKGQSIGLVVDRILDIVEESFVMRPDTGRKGVQGSAVIQKRVTDILDVPQLLQVVKGQGLRAAAAHA
jgi:two-component system, chemotaxis family, sensor kinase CheA